MNKKILILNAAAFIILSSIYLFYQHSRDTPDNVQISIQVDRDTYTPVLSSTVGIGLVPIHTSERPLETVRYRWHTSYGHFVSWGPPDHKVTLLGTETTNSGEKIYWSYDPGEMDKNKPIVQISLTVENALSGRPLAESVLEIGWEEQHIAKVKPKDFYFQRN